MDMGLLANTELFKMLAESIDHYTNIRSTEDKQ